jgi:hypothetical protein
MAPSGAGSVYQNHFPEGLCAHLCQAPGMIANLGTTEVAVSEFTFLHV